MVKQMGLEQVALSRHYTFFSYSNSSDHSRRMWKKVFRTEAFTLLTNLPVDSGIKRQFGFMPYFVSFKFLF